MDKPLFGKSARESKSRDSRRCNAAVIALLSWYLFVPGLAPGLWSSPNATADSGWTVIQTFQRQEDCQRAANALRSEAYAWSAIDVDRGLDETKISQAENARCVNEGKDA
jgi:hypothetical protein